MYREPRLWQQTVPTQAPEGPKGPHRELAHQLLAPREPCTDDTSKTNDQLVSPTYSLCLRDCGKVLDFFLSEISFDTYSNILYLNINVEGELLEASVLKALEKKSSPTSTIAITEFTQIRP